MKKKDDCYEIRVDNETSRENVTRYAEHQGYHVSVSEEAGDYVLLAQRP
jgi:tRNA 2-thiouridine synthesizing protein A